jgi:hypothetical protein
VNAVRAFAQKATQRGRAPPRGAQAPVYMTVGIYNSLWKGKMMPSKVPSEAGLIEKIRSLPPEKAAEVEDFVDFLRDRGQAEARLLASSMKLSEKAFHEVWDNPDDAAYDSL